MKSSELVLFESAQSCLRLSVNTMYESENNGNTRQLVYINNNNGKGYFRPSVFLAFTYVTEDYTTTKNVVATIPHMYKVRKAFRTMNEMISDPNAFTVVGNALTVTQGYDDTLVVDLSAKSGDWLSLTLTSASANNTEFKAVMIQGSKFYNQSAAVLTEDEFNAIYDIIEHVDLVSLENQAVLMALATSGTTYTKAANTNYSGQQTQYNPRPQVQRQSTYQQPVNNRPTYQTQSTYQAQNTVPAYRQSQPQQAAQPTVNKMPPRPATAPKVNLENIQNIPVDDFNIDDADLVNDLFSDTSELQ